VGSIPNSNRLQICSEISILCPYCLALLQEKNIEGLRMLEPAFDERDQYMHRHLHKKHANLSPRVGNAFRAVKADGTYERYFQQVFTPLVQKLQ
jgi:hypothetical protein